MTKTPLIVIVSPMRESSSTACLHGNPMQILVSCSLRRRVTRKKTIGHDSQQSTTRRSSNPLFMMNGFPFPLPRRAFLFRTAKRHAVDSSCQKEMHTSADRRGRNLLLALNYINGTRLSSFKLPTTEQESAFFDRPKANAVLRQWQCY